MHLPCQVTFAISLLPMTTLKFENENAGQRYLAARIEWVYHTRNRKGRVMPRLTIWASFFLIVGGMSLAGQQASEAKPIKLLSAKLVYIDHMPNNLDQWLIEDLHVWGKYKRTVDPEGVDLVIQAEVPERQTELDMRGGIPRPRQKKSGGVHLPGT